MALWKLAALVETPYARLPESAQIGSRARSITNISNVGAMAQGMNYPV